MQTTGTTTEPVYRRLPIQGGPDQPCRTAALAKVFRSFSCMLSRHERLLTTRFDVRLPDPALCAPKHHHVRSCLGEYQQRFEQEGADPLCVWIDRPTEPDLPSIHSGLILLDGDRVQPLDSPLDTAEDWWGRVVDPPDSSVWIDPGGPHDPRPLFGSGVMIDRGDPDWWRTFQYCFHWTSGMAQFASDSKAWPEPASSCALAAPPGRPQSCRNALNHDGRSMATGTWKDALPGAKSSGLMRTPRRANRRILRALKALCPMELSCFPALGNISDVLQETGRCGSMACVCRRQGETSSE